jgi:hypothetical protein
MDVDFGPLEDPDSRCRLGDGMVTSVVPSGDCRGCFHSCRFFVLAFCFASCVETTAALRAPLEFCGSPICGCHKQIGHFHLEGSDLASVTRNQPAGL